MTLGRGTSLRALLLSGAVAALGCADGRLTDVAGARDLPQEGRIRVQNDESVLRARVRVLAQPLAIRPVGPALSVQGGSPAGGSDDGFSLALIAEVAPPEVDGIRLQASHSLIQGSRAYVTYNVQGPVRKGGVDVFDVSHPESVELSSSALFMDAEVSAADLHGASDLYLATATDDPAFATPAVLEVVELHGGQLTTTSRRVGLPSYAGTGVRVQGGTVYVTSGSGGDPVGGLSVFDRTTLERAAFDPFEDARAVDVRDGLVVALRGTPGELRLYDGKGLTFERSFASGGANVPESKGTVSIAKPCVFYAAGDGGLRVVDLESGGMVATLPVPDVEGVAPEDEVTNGVSTSGDLVFIANGGAGLFVARASRSFDDGDGGADRGAACTSCDVQLVLLGQVRFPGDESANYVASRGNLLFVAHGLGGLSILKIQR
jgi:hypothetical protein